MEQNTLHDAADWITYLLKSTDVPNAIRPDVVDTRNALRQLAYEQEESDDGYTMPEVGDTLYDNGCPVDVVEVTDYTARLYHIENGNGPSVAQYDANAEYDPDAPVVKVTYPGGETVYPMPLDRLSWDK